MGRLRTITRRSFLVGSVAVAGGVAFGTYEVLRTPENPLHPEDGVTLNPWVIIDRRGVTVIVPRAEMGQGVQTTLAALVAEELDISLESLNIEHGPPAEAYANRVLLLDRDYSAGEPSGVGGALMQALPKVLKLQITGGSSSAVDAFDRMRHAGAAAREVLLLAASDRLGIGIDQLHAEDGHIVAADGSRIAYADLAEQAATLTPPKAPRLKRPSDWTLLGKSQPRRDQPAKATGTAGFGIDTRLPGLRFATVKMSPRLGGGMLSFDASEAEKMPGVEAVIDLGEGFAVVAGNTWLAMQAAEAVKVAWGEAPYPAETEGIFTEMAGAFDGKPNITARDEGDATAGERPVSAEYTAPFLAHATMEPMNATALYSGDGLEIWAGNQVPVMLQQEVAKAVGLKPDQVTLHTPFLGGGFGRRLVPDYALQAAKVAKALPGTPVKLTWSREEDMRHDQYRPGAIARLEARLEGGRIAALTADIASPSLMRQMMKDMVGLDMSPSDRTLIEGAGNQPYAIENIRVQGFAAEPGVPVGSWRSVGSSQNAFFWESFIDELAHEAGEDPLAFRLAHIRPEHEASAQVLEKVAEISGWTGKSPAGTGRGVAFTHSFGTPVAEVVELVDEGGLIRIAKLWIAADPGLVLDPGNVEAQLTGGAVFGLSAAVHGEITFEDGMVVEKNFPDYDALRINNVPRFEVALLQSGTRPTGVGEPGTPPAAPALANALYDLTGKRARRLPLWRDFDFVS